MTTPASRPSTVLLQLREPASKGQGAPSIQAFLELAFRPLYLAGISWALVAIALWVYAPGWLNGPLSGLAWHAHEMLWGFIATIALAFLMTAGTSWTGVDVLSGRPLAVVCCLWVIARAGFLLPWDVAFWVATVAELAFFGWGSFAMLRAVVRTKNSRNYAVPGLLAGLGAMDALYLLTAHGGGDYAVLMQRFNAGMVVMALIALLIGRRVIPFFAMRAVPGLEIPKHTETGWVQLGACGLAVVSLLAGWSVLNALALAVAGTLALVQVMSWKPLAVRSNALLWILYLPYGAIGLGLLLAALASAGVDLPRVLPVHAIAMAGFSVLILGMVTRTALGHTGRPLVTDRTIRTSYWLMLVAVVLRLGAIAVTPLSAALLYAAGAAWIAALSLYLWQFAPILVRPRH